MSAELALIALTEFQYEEGLEVKTPASAFVEAEPVDCGWRVRLVISSSALDLQVRSSTTFFFRGERLPDGGRILLADGVDDIVGMVTLGEDQVPLDFIFSPKALEEFVKRERQPPFSDIRPKFNFSRRSTH